MPAISIIIPTRNRRSALLRAVNSARNAGNDVEIVIVDDASEDGTQEMCARLPNIRYLRLHHRLGVVGARNVGIIASSSEYISFLDDDDVRLPGSLDEEVEMLEAQPDAGMIYGQALYGDQDCQPKGGFYPLECPQGDIFWPLMRWNFIPCATVVFRRASLLRVGLLEEAAPGIDDWDLWIRIAEFYPVLAVPKPLAIWRTPTRASGQLSSQIHRMHGLMYRLHKDKWMRLPRATAQKDDLRHNAAHEFAECATQQLIWEAAARLKENRWRSCVQVLFTLVRFYPFVAARKAFRASTWSFVVNGARNWRRAVEQP